MHVLARIAGVSLLAMGCASTTPPLLGEVRCPAGTTERIETREPNLEDHRCEDAQGLAQGVAWTSDGVHVRSLGNYRNGELHGTTRIWSEHGSLWAEIAYREGVTTRLRSWHDSGHLAEEWRYKDAENADIWKWDEEGKLTDELYQRNGDIEGWWTKYWPDGTVKRRAEWHAGKLDGGFSEWYESGSPRAQGRYAKDRKVGSWRFWDEAGAVTVRVY
jgi:antitoxin component YwqK of YwqJK toxin-antitoxin module